MVRIGSIADCSSEGVAYAFLDRVFSRFGSPTKVLTDQNSKFHGEFQELCEKALIDHRMTSRDHLEVDGLIERMVQMVKRRLQKYGLHKSHTRNWDLQLSWLVMGYRFNQ